MSESTRSRRAVPAVLSAIATIALLTEPCSPPRDLKHRTWYIVSGGAGAPYYSEGPTPWSRYWKDRPAEERAGVSNGYLYRSRENVCIFHADDRRISLHVYNPDGELIDQIEDLMAVRR